MFRPCFGHYRANDKRTIKTCLKTTTTTTTKKQQQETTKTKIRKEQTEVKKTKEKLLMRRQNEDYNLLDTRR